MQLHNSLLIQPVSAAKMATGLNPDRVLTRYFGDISTWVTKPTNDVAIMFTTGLYQNNDTPDARKQRYSLLQRQAEWTSRFQKLLHKNSGQSINGFPLMREGFQMVGWDDNLTQNWTEFSDNIGKLQQAYKKDTSFKNMIDDEIRGMNREPTEANIAFIFEELAITALWLKGQVPVEKGLRRDNKLDAIHIVYPSPFQRFMVEGLNLLLKNKRSVLPLVWLDTSDEQTTIPMTFRFGLDAPVMQRI